MISEIQKEAKKLPCPHCGEGELHEVDAIDSEIEGEIMLWCNNCLLSMDSSGGYVC